MTNPVKPTIGRIVHYTLTLDDAAAINRRHAWRMRLGSGIHWLRSVGLYKARSIGLGYECHIGLAVSEGEVYPMIVARVWPDLGVNGQVFLDGTDTLWVTSVSEGTEPGTWHWPPR